MLLQDLVRVSEEVAATASRRVKIDRLAELLARFPPEDVEVGVRYLTGEPRQHRLGLGPAAIRSVTARAAAHPTLTITDVDGALQRIEDTPAGSGSRTARLAVWTELLGRARPEEQAWLVKLVLRELRQGALAGVLLPAVARAAAVPERAVRRAAMLNGDLANTAALALTGGQDALAAVGLVVGVPVEPMLATTATGLTDALAGRVPALVETKLDGARLQVHRDGADVRLFTRTGQDVTDRLPEVVAVARSLPTNRVVLDGEVVAFDTDGRPRPFQETMQRIGRDHDVTRVQREVPVELRAFDLLHLDGIDLLDEPLATRRAALHHLVPEPLRAEGVVTDRLDVARDFTRQVLTAGHEGVIVKDLDDAYAAGRRGASWRKVKPVHTLDLVVLAAEWGSGRRRGWLSNLHLGARADSADIEVADTDAFVLLGKTFKGLTDEVLAWQTEALLARETRREGHVVHVRPELVVEIALDGVVRSSRYPGGVSLRFARVRGYRPDKRPQDVDTLATVRAIHAGARLPELG
ncbi:MAG: ATP-dependent DNA ligase [Nitriliruptor sp.]|nr:MAG: ATP-dependent DNA ligase [Nitriliruptor sp.]